MSTAKRREGDGQPPPEDLSRVTSSVLTEVRTVLSRARTAYAPHPQGEEMVEALRKVVELLEPWERTGR